MVYIFISAFEGLTLTQLSTTILAFSLLFNLQTRNFEGEISFKIVRLAYVFEWAKMYIILTHALILIVQMWVIFTHLKKSCASR